MSKRHVLACLFACVAVLGLPSRSHAAAQLKAGAKTSAQPTSTNPSLRQIQLTFDPGDGSYNVTSFQLSVSFDPTMVNVASAGDIALVAPYSDPAIVTTALKPGATLSSPFNSTGLVSGVGGVANVGDTQGGDVNIFSITFTLDQSVSLDDVMSFTLFAQSFATFETAGANPSLSPGDDFIGFTNPQDPTDHFIAGPNAIIPITITGSFNSFAAQVNAAAAGGAATPLPTGAWTGAFSLALLAAWARFRGFRCAA